MFRILQVREASQQKSLQGLDNIAEEGAEAFESVHKIVDDLKECGASATWCNEVQNGLKNGKRYLKTEYRVHCREEESLCPDHCRYFALSDLQDPELKQSCSYQHQMRCSECEHLKVTLQSIAEKIDSPSIKEKKPEVNQVSLRSDGAGCYHNNNLIAATYDIGVRVGVKVIR